MHNQIFQNQLGFKLSPFSDVLCNFEVILTDSNMRINMAVIKNKYLIFNIELKSV